MAPARSEAKREPNRARVVFDVLKQSFSDWQDDKAPRLAAALAFYAALSIAPILIIAIAVAGLAFGQDAARGEIFREAQGLVGADSAKTIESMVEGAARPRTGVWATVLSIGLLLFGASGVFGELQGSLNQIWEVEPKPGRGILQTLRQRFLSLAMVLVVGFLLLVSLIASSVLAALGKWLEGSLPGAPVVWQLVSFVVSFGLATVLFALIFKVLPDVKISWNDVWIGAAATALLFSIGKTLLGLYLGRSSVASTYGAAGSVVVMLLWVYYSAQILFFGAELTQIYARKFGSRIVPAEHAQAVPEQGEKAEQRRRAAPPEAQVPTRAG
jgi:membrane protein